MTREKGVRGPDGVRREAVTRPTIEELEARISEFIVRVPRRPGEARALADLTDLAARAREAEEALEQIVRAYPSPEAVAHIIARAALRSLGEKA